MENKLFTEAVCAATQAALAAIRQNTQCCQNQRRPRRGDLASAAALPMGSIEDCGWPVGATVKLLFRAGIPGHDNIVFARRDKWGALCDVKSGTFLNEKLWTVLEVRQSGENVDGREETDATGNLLAASYPSTEAVAEIAVKDGVYSAATIAASRRYPVGTKLYPKPTRSAPLTSADIREALGRRLGSELSEAELKAARLVELAVYRKLGFV